MQFQSQTITKPLFKLADGAEESMWDDYEFGADRSQFAEYYDDFFVYNAGEWTVTSTGTGSRAITDVAGGVLLLTTGSTDDNSEELQTVGEVALPAAGKKLWFEARYYVEDATDSDSFIGLSDTDTTLVDGVSDGLYFSHTDGAAGMTFSSTSGSTTSSESGIHTLVANTYVKVGFKVVGTGLVEYWVDNVKQGSITSNIPTTEMAISFAIQTGSAAAHKMGIDYIRLVQER
ncbi:conserved hypothetical protein [uncultured Thiomicrorhabdus sp.]